ncbi:unnamed protein product [Effrenium voratum]|nr:unnamed protein product [Effrenium voratum]
MARVLRPREWHEGAGNVPPFPGRPPRPRPIADLDRQRPAESTEHCEVPSQSLSYPRCLPSDLALDWRCLQACSPARSRARGRTCVLEPIGVDQESKRQVSMPIIRNLPSFDRPQAYASALRDLPLSQASGSSRSSASRKCRPAASPIDQAIRRELVGDGIALEEVVESKRSSGWAVKQRQAQRNDLGHFCYGCRQPLRDLNEEVTVWTGAAIYRRFHPACAASYVLRADGSEQRNPADVVEGYADGWRAPREYVRPVAAARQWLLSEDQRAWGSLRGDLFTTVTVTENGKKKAVPGLSHEQLRLLQAQHRWVERSSSLSGEEALECAVCFCAPDSSSLCIRLPCAPQHVFHLNCVLPWLKKASLCPTCRTDLRPLLRNPVASDA